MSRCHGGLLSMAKFKRQFGSVFSGEVERCHVDNAVCFLSDW